MAKLAYTSGLNNRPRYVKFKVAKMQNFPNTTYH